ncbi:Transposase DDE domain group 1 [Porphyromonadaceae bacterium NLAE-zl-C104]|nr:Transposase DDE domain group 1 [Porphyromonadaceae bacterium KH3R12]SFS81464.1 Transposase DDE domain group 1 [Porphyromonadaceae bacterium NLAE-zl-C104]
MIEKTRFQNAKSWQVDTIRTLLLKVGGTIKRTKKRIIYKLSKSFVYKDLFTELLAL